MSVRLESLLVATISKSEVQLLLAVIAAKPLSRYPLYASQQFYYPLILCETRNSKYSSSSAKTLTGTIGITQQRPDKDYLLPLCVQGYNQAC